MLVGILVVTACGGSDTPPKEPAPQPIVETARGAPPSTPPAKRDDAPPAEGPVTASDEIPAPPDAPPPATDADRQSDAKQGNAFAVKVMLRAGKKDRGNVMVSGTSLRQAFGAAYVGTNRDLTGGTAALTNRNISNGTVVVSVSKSF
jgi:hypothetical protein